jgi:hypothetical protein
VIVFDHADRARDRPDWFSGREVEEARRQIAAFLALPERQRAQTDPPPVWKLSTDPTVLTALERRSNGLCAFCECRAPLQAWRFRPPAYATPSSAPDDRIAYLWRAFDWPNFFPICSECLPRERSGFPVKGRRERNPILTQWPANPTDILVTKMPDAPPRSGRGRPPPPLEGWPPDTIDERPLRYHPGEFAQLSRAFTATIDGGLLPLNARASETIGAYRLDRPDLRERRRVVAEAIARELRRAPGAPGETLRRFTGIDSVVGWPETPRPEHAGFAYLVLRAIFAGTLTALGLEGSLSVARIPRTVDRCEAHPDFASALVAGLDAFVTAAEASEASDDAVPAAPLPPEEPAARRRAHPRIASVSLRDFKSLERIDLALPPMLKPDADEILTEPSMEPPSAPCLLILGENATGKSSVLEGVALACLAKPERDALVRSVGLRPRRLTLDPRYMGVPEAEPRDAATLEVEFHPAEDGTLCSRLTLTARRAGDEGVFEATGDLAGPRPFVFAYGPNRLYGGARREEPWRHLDTLFDSGRQLSNPERWLIELSRRPDGALDQVVAALRHIIQIDGHFESVEIAPDPMEGGAPCAWIHLTREGPEGRRATLRQRLAFASSGYRAVLALVCDVLEGLMADGATVYEARTSNAVVLIDEIEAHLHPRWKLRIISGLRRALPRATFLLTSHDPLCVRGMRPGEVMMLNRHLREPETAGDGVDEMEVVERVADFGVFERMTVEQLLTSDMFQLVSVDDPRAEIRYADVAALLGRRAEIEAARREGRAPSVIPLNEVEIARLRAFHDEIAVGMPAGVTEVTTLVQKAVADFLRDRRALGEAHRRDRRERVEQEIRDFLQELLR